MPRNVRFVHDENVLDAPIQLQSDRRPAERQIRRRHARNRPQFRHAEEQQGAQQQAAEKPQIGGHNDQQHPHEEGEQAETQVRLPAEAVQLGAQAAGREGFGLLRNVAGILR